MSKTALEQILDTSSDIAEYFTNIYISHDKAKKVISDARAELSSLSARVERAERERNEARARVAELEAASAALTNRLRYVHNDSEYKDVWLLAQNHRGEYRGPQYDKELAALELVLEGGAQPATLTPRRCGGCTEAAKAMREAAVSVALKYSMRFDPLTTEDFVARETENKIKALPLPSCDGCNPLKTEAVNG